MQIPSRKRLVTGIALALVTAALSSPTSAPAAQACPVDPDGSCLVASESARQAQSSQPSAKAKKPKVKRKASYPIVPKPPLELGP
jgi:hypothetical protein